jgi:hypothetical protein
MLHRNRDLLEIISMYSDNASYDKPLPPIPGHKIATIPPDILSRQISRTMSELAFRSRGSLEQLPLHTRNLNFQPTSKQKNERRRGAIFLDTGKNESGDLEFPSTQDVIYQDWLST